jgi:hypothetical protein
LGRSADWSSMRSPTLGCNANLVSLPSNCSRVRNEPYANGTLSAPTLLAQLSRALTLH